MYQVSEQSTGGSWDWSRKNTGFSFTCLLRTFCARTDRKNEIYCRLLTNHTTRVLTIKARLHRPKFRYHSRTHLTNLAGLVRATRDTKFEMIRKSRLRLKRVKSREWLKKQQTQKNSFHCVLEWNQTGVPNRRVGSITKTVCITVVQTVRRALEFQGFVCKYEWLHRWRNSVLGESERTNLWHMKTYRKKDTFFLRA